MLLVLFYSNGLAQDYKIGPGDQLQISFWEDPTLNVELKVGEDGMISLDILGQVEAAGKTTKELQEDIANRMSRLKREISQAVVRVTQFDYLYLFVSGQVRNGGRLTFEQIPDLWTVINLAGGIGESGDLSRVTIVRGGDQTGRVEVVNVAEAIANGTLDKLPKLRRGDTIDIPRTPGGIPSGDLSSQSGIDNYVYILGAVTTPGTVNFEPEMDLLQALAAAGGYTENADLGQVKVITNDGRFAKTLQFDLDKYMKNGSNWSVLAKR
ncbi:MAG: polysaccharide export protein, partial [bacterium]|nr:polysaccharide export protein [bacterium]